MGTGLCLLLGDLILADLDKGYVSKRVVFDIFTTSPTLWVNDVD
jgi:hypothetical protein